MVPPPPADESCFYFYLSEGIFLMITNNKYNILSISKQILVLSNVDFFYKYFYFYLFDLSERLFLLICSSCQAGADESRLMQEI
jgi:hypothetical protein